MHTKYYAVGLMSGTSMDGVDSALIHTDGESYANFLDHDFIPYPSDFQKKLKQVEKYISSQKGIFSYNHAISEHETIADIIQQSTQYHINCAQKLLQRNNSLLKNQICFIGYHGQTFFHNPPQKISVISGDPAFMANVLKQPVFFHFRDHDLQNNGKGAPLAPIYHFCIAQHSQITPSAFINCGGIANISIIPDHNVNDMIAFDIGPGNTLLDSFIKQKTNNLYQMDRDGLFGKQGQVCEKSIGVLENESCLQKDYYYSAPPKALDISDFHLPESIQQLSLEDGCKTLAYFTAKKIVDSTNFMSILPKRWFVSGGGFQNPNITEGIHYYFIQKNMTNISLEKTDVLNFPSQSLEAQLFAYLAIRSHLQLPISFPKTTGIQKPLTGGIYYEPKT